MNPPALTLPKPAPKPVPFLTAVPLTISELRDILQALRRQASNPPKPPTTKEERDSAWLLMRSIEIHLEDAWGVDRGGLLARLGLAADAHGNLVARKEAR